MPTKPQVSEFEHDIMGSLGITTEFENSRIPVLHLLMTWCYFITMVFQYFKKGNIHQFVFSSLWFHGLQYDRPSWQSATPRTCSNSCPLSWWCHPSISSSVNSFSHLQSFPASGSFRMSQFFASGGQIIGVSESDLPMNTKDWSPLQLTGLISLQPKWLSRVFNTIVQKHQFLGAQLSLWPNSHIHTWLLEKP